MCLAAYFKAYVPYFKKMLFKAYLNIIVFKTNKRKTKKSARLPGSLAAWPPGCLAASLPGCLGCLMAWLRPISVLRFWISEGLTQA